MATADELLDAGKWAEARVAYRRELDESETPRSHDGVARASRALGDTVAATKAWEQAYRLYVRVGDTAAAASAATSIAEVALASTGDEAVARGWLERARHHLRGHPDDPTLVMTAALQAYVALAFEKDPTRALVFAEEAWAHARRLLDTTAEIAAKAHLGLILVCGGQLDDGMRLLDEATAAALGGELSLEDALDTYCVLITACERVRDHGRVLQWARHVLDAADAAADDGFATFARTEYAHVLAQTGSWDDAERQLRLLTENPDARPVGVAMAQVFLADLLRQRGDLVAADEALQVAEREPWRRAVRHLVMATRADLFLANGEAQEASDLARRYLRSVSEDAKPERVGPLETLTAASVALGDLSTASASAEELAAIAEVVPTPGVKAAAVVARARVETGRGELAGAVESFQRAVDLYEQADMHPDVIATRVEMARVHVARGEFERATNQAERARRDAEHLGAHLVASEAGAVLAGLRPGDDSGSGGLTARELEVLRLVAAGATNAEIAEQLVLSVRTVERHLSNIYLKIGTTGPSARAAASSYAHRHALT